MVDLNLAKFDSWEWYSCLYDDGSHTFRLNLAYIISWKWFGCKKNGLYNPLPNYYEKWIVSRCRKMFCQIYDCIHKLINWIKLRCCSINLAENVGCLIIDIPFVRILTEVFIQFFFNKEYTRAIKSNFSWKCF